MNLIVKNCTVEITNDKIKIKTLRVCILPVLIWKNQYSMIKSKANESIVKLISRKFICGRCTTIIMHIL